MLAPTASKLATRQLMPHNGGGAGGCQATTLARESLPVERPRAGRVWQLPGCLAFSPPPLSTFPPKTDGHPRPARVVFVKAVVQIHSHTSGKNSCELGSSLSSGKLLIRRLLARRRLASRGRRGRTHPCHPAVCIFLRCGYQELSEAFQPLPCHQRVFFLILLSGSRPTSPPLANSPGTCILAVFGRLQPFGEQRV